MLILPIKKKWFDMILSGDKKEEYREIKPYYEARFSRYFLGDTSLLVGGKLNEWLFAEIKFCKPVKFRNGYSSKSPYFIAKCQLTIGKGKPEWGAEPEKQYYILKIMEIEKPNKELGSEAGIPQFSHAAHCPTELIEKLREEYAHAPECINNNKSQAQ